MWKNVFEVNIYKMAGSLFLFEFPNRNMADQIMQGEWVWKNSTIRLEWWSPFVGYAPFNRRKLRHESEQ